MPEGSGAIYVASWMAADGGNCYQLVEAPDRAALDGGIANWSDLVDFVVIEVKGSAEFWASWRAALTNMMLAENCCSVRRGRW